MVWVFMAAVAVAQRRLVLPLTFAAAVGHRTVNLSNIQNDVISRKLASPSRRWRARVPEDLEILWTSALVYIQPVTEQGMEWLQDVMPRRLRWDMRTMSFDDLEGFALAARKRRLTVGGVSVPPEELE